MADAIELPERPASITVARIPATKTSGYRDASSGRDGDTFVLTIRRRGLAGLPFLVFALLWDAIVAVMVWFGGDLVALCALSPFVAVGVGLTVSAVADIASPRRIRVGGGRLTSRHAPFQLRRSVNVDATRLQRIVRAAHNLDDDGKTALNYRLSAVLDETVHTFVWAITLEEANYLTAAIERHLGLARPPV